MAILRGSKIQRFVTDCEACQGKVECLGGAELRCVQRDPRVSLIAGILDGYGGVRVVVGHREQFKHHRAEGEFVCIVLGKKLHEPIAWGDIPYVIRLGEMAVERWIEGIAGTNDPVKQAAILAYKSRKTWHLRKSFDAEAICFT